MSNRYMLAAVVAVAFTAMPARAADRPPTADERSKIESVLKAEGFQRWDDIEWDDDGYWEVDDAVAQDGREYDLKLNAEYAIIVRDPD
ncbi:hypothetical protein FHS85_005286 [Rhodoligotrophos appendicifer]|uniref:PepSY domain-containing protein n=1 Tax=Rhodoligotrophos appendicifer TaxID=987056 RepID=UPI0011862391|nr:PepSY domain-containing protein [Rhodoligotrophos appendicifer]